MECLNSMSRINDAGNVLSKTWIDIFVIIAWIKPMYDAYTYKDKPLAADDVEVHGSSDEGHHSAYEGVRNCLKYFQPRNQLQVMMALALAESFCATGLCWLHTHMASLMM
jgi:hypothetical protein